MEAHGRERFDIALFDIRMPVMSGIEAAAAILAAETGEPGRLPIIALTSNAMTGDRERRLAAGMDGYIARRSHKGSCSTLWKKRL